MQGGDEADARPRNFVPQQDAPPRVPDLYVRKEEVLFHGPTTGCQRCRAIWDKKSSTKPHTEACRDRFRELLTSTDKGRRKVERAKDRMDAEAYRKSEVIEQDDENDKKKHRQPAEPEPTTAMSHLGASAVPLKGN